MNAVQGVRVCGINLPVATFTDICVGVQFIIIFALCSVSYFDLLEPVTKRDANTLKFLRLHIYQSPSRVWFVNALVIIECL